MPNKMNLRFLTEAYQPIKILKRERQITEITKVFNFFRERGAVSNKLIQGVTGSGKTATIYYVVSQRKEDILFASGMLSKTSLLILNAISGSNYRNKSQVLMRLIEQLRKNPKTIIIDEIHKIKDYKELLQDLNSIYREAHIPIIIITNKRMFLKDVEEDIKKTLFFQRIEFLSYDALELKEILNDRLRLANTKLPTDVKNYICAVGSQTGSARLVLDLAYKCLLENKTTQAFVKDCLKKIQEDEWHEFIYNLPPSEKKVLKLILDLYSTKNVVYTSDLLKELNGFTLSRLSQIITGLESYDIIQTKIINKGRAGGRFRSIEFISEDVFKQLDNLL